MVADLLKFGELFGADWYQRAESGETLRWRTLIYTIFSRSPELRLRKPGGSLCWQVGSGKTAQAQLALSNTPVGYFQVPYRNAIPFIGPTIVQPNPDNNQPGGGTEIKAAHPVSIQGRMFFPICQ